MRNLTRKLLMTACLMLPAALCAEGWIPYIDTHPKEEYGNGASTWRIASYGSWTLFANQRGLLVYDGSQWARYPLNNCSEARGVGVFPQSRKIYVGGEDEYGYFDVDDAGLLRYHCLSEHVDEKYAHLGNLFDFYELNGSIYMRGDNYILMRTGEQMALLQSPGKMFSSTMAGGTIYVATDQGVWMIAGRQFVPLNGGQVLENKRINVMLSKDDQLLIATANDGIYRYDGHEVQPVTTPADALIRQGVVCCAAVRKDKIAIGTIHKGLIVIDTKTGEVQQFDESKGLQNNTVLSVAFDERGNVWAGLSYGIDHVLLESPFSYLYRLPFSYGIGYSAQLKDGLLYLGTDRGLYYTPYPVVFADGKPDIRQTNCPSGPAWYLYADGDELFCMHDKGLFEIRGGQATRITDIIGAWSCCKVQGRPDQMFVGVYDGMYLIRKVDGQWRRVARIEGIRQSGRYFRQSGDHQLKVYNPASGKAVQYVLNSTLTKVVSQQPLTEQWQDDHGPEPVVYDNSMETTGAVLHLSKQRSVVPIDKGFMMVDYQKISDYEMPVRIRRMQSYPNDSTVYQANLLGLRPEPVIAWENNSVRFEYDVPGQPTTPFQFQYRLNSGEWSAPSTINAKEFSHLREGKYVFEVRVVFPDGRIASDAVTFRILTPWYRTWLAYLVVTLLAGGALLRWENRRIARKQALAVKEQTRQVENMKIEIDKLEKDKLDLDLRHKSQEIANLILNITRKNEILSEIKIDVKRVATRMGIDTPKESKRELLLINNKIESNIEGDEVLKRFEEEFDLVNDNFMKKLSKVHPELTHNERLMCAYLKMNLSTKEIAPLLNISVRGVETNRYRMRKKLGLERDSSIIEYLNQIENTPLEKLA